MQKHQGNIWTIYKEADYFVFTGNAFIKNNDALVMGRGLAKEVRDKFSGIDIRIGKHIIKSTTKIETQYNGEHLRKYGFIHLGKIGIFQVKYHYTETADIQLIKHSTSCLREFAKKHKDKQIHMNYPGIGYGKLTEKEVYSIIKNLPNNIHIWKFKCLK